MACNRRLIREEIQRFRNRHIENFGDVLSFESDLQSVSVVPIAFAHFTRHIHIGQEVHFNLDSAIATARFTPTALHVKTETTRLIAANF